MANKELQIAAGPLKHLQPYQVPGSKSITNRALVLAAMAEGQSRLTGLLFSDDSRHMLEALRELGLDLSYNESEAWAEVSGCGGRLRSKEPAPEVFVGNAGTAARFLPCMVAAAQGSARFKADPRMSIRPMQSLLDVLQDQGSDIEGKAYPFELRGAGFKGGPVRVDVSRSSQFASGLMMAAPAARQPLLLEISGRKNTPYVAMTIAMMKEFGIEAVFESGAWTVPLGVYRGREYSIEPDVSGACYLFAAAALLGGKVTVAGLSRASMQADIAFLQVLRHMGCEFYEDVDGLTIEKDPAVPLKGVDVDMNAFSDQGLTLAALAPYCDTPLRIRNIEHSRLQECDRVSAMAQNLRAMGINIEERRDGLDIFPGEPCPAEIKTHSDHRVAMAFSLCGLRSEGISIDDPACVSKTFENYWDVFEALRKASGA